jgi:FHS family glucose/mannose:H+ symporter-like MFS transporter
MSINARSLITVGAFFSLSLVGMSRTFTGTALPAIRTTLVVTILQAGTLTALLQLGFSAAVFFGGPISDIYKRSLILKMGCLLMGIHLIFFGHSEGFWLALVSMAFVGIGGGLIESSSNPLLVQLYPGRESSIMNLHHFFFAMGSLAGPIIMGTLLANSIPWQWGYIGFGIFVLSLCIFLPVKSVPAHQNTRGFDVRQIERLMIDRTFLSLFFVLFFNSGVQNGICFWMVSFLKETRGLSIALASFSLFLFFACAAVGRLLASYVITRIHEAMYLPGLLSLFLLSLLLAVLVPGAWSIPFFALCGFAHSGITPSLLGVVGRCYSEIPGTAMGILATGAGLGSVVVPWLMSLVSQLTTLKTGFLSLNFFIVIALLLMGTQVRRLKQIIPSRALV